jgi:hypothetical protein
MDWTWLGIVVVAFLLFSGYRGYQRGFIKEVVSIFFVILSVILVWFINPYVNEFLRENTSVYEKVQEGCLTLVSGTEAEQTGEEEQKNTIENLNFPDLLKNGLTENNTIEVYQYLAASTFGEYVAGYLATAVVNGLSFLLSFLLTTILIRTISCALNVIAGLPVIRVANRTTGGLLGIVKGIIFIWIAFLVLTVLCNTTVGKTGLELVKKDYFLNVLYEKDVFVRIFMNIFYGN